MTLFLLLKARLLNKIHEKQKILAGDIVAAIDQPNLLQQLAEAKSKLAQLKPNFKN